MGSYNHFQALEAIFLKSLGLIYAYSNMNIPLDIQIKKIVAAPSSGRILQLRKNPCAIGFDELQPIHGQSDDRANKVLQTNLRIGFAARQERKKEYDMIINGHVFQPAVLGLTSKVRHIRYYYSLHLLLISEFGLL